MRLLVSCIPYDKGKSGISVYTREVVRALAGQGHELTLLLEPDAQGREGLASSCQASPVISAPRWTRRPLLSMLWHLFFLPFWIWRRRRDFDGFVICAANRRACAWYPLPTTATVHDLANFHIKGKYSRSRMFYLAHVLPFLAMRAQHLVAISEATKADMVRFWRCRPNRITVLYDGLSAPQLAGAAPAQSSAPQLEQGGPSGRPEQPRQSWLLYISRIEHPGKNHVRLIEAYGTLPRPLAEAHPLVLVGADWKDAGVVHEAAAKSPNAPFIRFTGFADNAALAAVWSQTGFYIFPSLFEGFGLSLVEAMARGIPCACSGNGSLGEIGGGVAITFDPESVESIATALRELLTEAPGDRARRITRGHERARRFSWPDHAAGLARLITKGTGR